MLPCGSEFHHGLEEEVALWQVAVRHLQAWQVDDDVVDCHDVDVDKAVHIIALGVAMAMPTIEFMLDIMDDIQRLDGRVLAIDGNAHIEEAVGTLKSPWLALDYAGACNH